MKRNTTLTKPFIENALWELRTSGKDLASELGVTQATVSLWHTGKKEPSGHNVLLVMTMLKLKAGEKDTKEDSPVAFF